ncbi:MerR family transcriptional regulator [Candidatus Uabimicrobium sp. HlEnr_7]|uniref:MerR family transcriptional regulator n=1 Tax=Candidatus Uabimicrobium helgolandensis TaxID=3095367 RepID=UPI003555C25C
MAIWISIGKVADLYGVTAQTIRNWKDEGEFKVTRTRGKHRGYSKEEIEKKIRIGA